MSDSLQPHGLLLSARLSCPWSFPDKNTGVGCHFLLQGIFLTQGPNPCLPHLLNYRLILYLWAARFCLYEVGVIILTSCYRWEKWGACRLCTLMSHTYWVARFQLRQLIPLLPDVKQWQLLNRNFLLMQFSVSHTQDFKSYLPSSSTCY